MSGPIEYRETALVRRYHDLPRMGYPKVVNLPTGWGKDLPETKEYYVGLVVLPITILAVLLAITIAFMITCCIPLMCKKEPKVKLGAYCVFSLVSIAAIVCYASVYSISIRRFQPSEESLEQGFRYLAGFVLDSLSILNKTTVTLNTFGSNNGNFFADCPEKVTVVVVNQTILAAAELLNSIWITTNSTIKDLYDDMNAFQDTLEKASEIRAIVVNLFATLLWVLIFFFWLVTTVKVIDDWRKQRAEAKRQRQGLGQMEEEQEEGNKTCAIVGRGILWCFSKTSCICVFSIGVFLLITCILVSLILNIVGVAGSDVCAGNPNQNIQRLYSQISGVAELETSFGTGTPICTPVQGVTFSQPADQFGTNTLLCYLQTCAGSPFLRSIFGEVDEFLTTLASINITEISKQQGIPISNECVASFDELKSSVITNLQGLMRALLSLISCASLNRIYAQIVYTSMCNGFVDAFLLSYEAFFAGSVLFLIAMGVYAIFHLEKGLREDQPEQDEEEEESAEFSPKSSTPPPTAGDITGLAGQNNNSNNNNNNSQSLDEHQIVVT